ncbi:hypothetical protein [Desulfovibrio sp. ZJ369]|uniref:hypothetical protein n=1 Tax=Desulfovibrio sp. ZJ369 TaxID=2709793 RepID=UPI0013EA97F6|nr:hypothetical protein [Desulfovibrio sp. ZJ369]
MPESRLIAHYSFLIPAKKYIADFDIITTSSPFSAFVELSIYLLDTLKVISPHELQSFLGINENERDSLIQQILSTDLAFTNDNGDLEVTSKVDELRQPDGSIQLEKYENHSASFFVDLASKHIQPRSSNPGKAGFFELIPEANFHSDLPAETIFKEDFNRFRSCNTNESIRNSKSRLYRINDCVYDALVGFPVSVNVISEFQSDDHLQITTSLSGFAENDIDLVVNSGILRYVNKKLNRSSEHHDSLLPEDYCANVQDFVLPDFFSDSREFDIEKYLLAREKRKTGYNSQKTAGLIGAIYLPQNRSRLIEWLRNCSSLQPILWVPSCSTYWGASAYVKAFYDDLHELLSKKGSLLSLIVPKTSTPQEAYELGQRFGGIVDTIQCVSTSSPLDEMEIMIVPGYPCWAMVQYHARISSRYNLRNIRIPIGYTTYDTERVRNLWTIMLKRANFSEESKIEPLEKRFTLAPEILDCFTHTPNWKTNMPAENPCPTS